MRKNEARQGFAESINTQPLPESTPRRLCTFERREHVCIISHKLAGVCWGRTVLRGHSSDMADHVCARPRPTCFHEFYCRRLCNNSVALKAIVSLSKNPSAASLVYMNNLPFKKKKKKSHFNMICLVQIVIYHV